MKLSALHYVALGAVTCVTTPFFIVLYDFLEIYFYTRRLRETLKKIPGNRGHWLLGQLKEVSYLLHFS